MVVYHGSDVVVDEPKILKSNRLLDFGMGFYTTSNKNQAIRWAKKVQNRNQSKKCYISIYNFEKEKAIKKLNVIYFGEANMEWLYFIIMNRNGDKTERNYDIAIGPVADDNVYLTVKLFETGILNEEETVKRLKIRKLFNQILFHSNDSLKFCSYKNYLLVGG
jgi:hypothetical protein